MYKMILIFLNNILLRSIQHIVIYNFEINFASMATYSKIAIFGKKF